jgi:hypothetical protein
MEKTDGSISPGAWLPHQPLRKLKGKWHFDCKEDLLNNRLSSSSADCH